MRASHRHDGCLDLAPGQHHVHADISEHSSGPTSQRSHRHGHGRRGLALQQKPCRTAQHQVALIAPYAPELNPVEHLWDELREKCFHNKVFDSIDALEDDLAMALVAMENTPEVIKSITNWPWINDVLSKWK